MEPAPDLIPFAERFIRNFQAGNAGAIIDAIAKDPDSLLIGTDDAEWYEGFEAISAYLRMFMGESESGNDLLQTEVDIDKILTWKEGSVGCITGHFRYHVPFSGEHSGRVTLVLHEEGAHWRIVNWHSSLAVTNEAVWGYSQATSVDDILALAKDYESPTAAIASDGTVAIVFTDIVGSTALMEQLGEQQWMELLDEHSKNVRQQTSVFGGVVVKGQGDGFMLAFPAIGSAAACAVAIQRSLVTDSDGIALGVRIGIHYGNARLEDDDFFGRTVVVAARLTGEANGEEILVSRAAQENLGGAYAFGESRTLTLKGLAGSHEVFPLLWQKP
jgi:class 3 adenylate cyclase